MPNCINPLPILESSLSTNAKMVLITLAAYADENGVVDVTRETICALTGMSDATVWRTLKSIPETWLTVDKDGTKHTYQFMALDTFQSEIFQNEMYAPDTFQNERYAANTFQNEMNSMDDTTRGKQAETFQNEMYADPIYIDINNKDIYTTHARAREDDAQKPYIYEFEDIAHAVGIVTGQTLDSLERWHNEPITSLLDQRANPNVILELFSYKRDPAKWWWSRFWLGRDKGQVPRPVDVAKYYADGVGWLVNGKPEPLTVDREKGLAALKRAIERYGPVRERWPQAKRDIEEAGIWDIFKAINGSWYDLNQWSTERLDIEWNRAFRSMVEQGGAGQRQSQRQPAYH